MVNVLDKDKILWYVMRAYKNENTAEDRLSNETYGLEYFIPKQKVLRTVKGKKVFFKEIYIETERIIIRNFKQKDAEGLLEYLSHPRVNCFAGDRLCSREAAWAYMQYSPKDMLRYAVSLKKMTLLSVTCSLCVRMKTLIMWGGISTNVLKAKDSLVKRQPDCWIIFSGRRAHGVSMDLWKMTISAPNAYANVLVCAAKDVSKSL